MCFSYNIKQDFHNLKGGDDFLLQKISFPRNDSLLDRIGSYNFQCYTTSTDFFEFSQWSPNITASTSHILIFKNSVKVRIVLIVVFLFISNILILVVMSVSNGIILNFHQIHWGEKFSGFCIWWLCICTYI